MISTVVHAPASADLLARLADHATLRTAPPEERRWLLEHGEIRTYQPGESLLHKGDEAPDMVIILTGRIAVYIDRPSGRRHVVESVAGEVTGRLPYSRLGRAPGDVLAEEATEVVAVHYEHHAEMTRACPVVTTTLVHAMLDRTREFVSTDWQDEKVASLGRLAAGMAHELNNPASAAMRSAQLLDGALREAEDASRLLGAADLDDAQRAAIVAVRDESLTRADGILSAIELSDREDELCDWLAAHGADSAAAAALADSGVTASRLDELAEQLPPHGLPLGLRWIAAGYTVRSLAADIERTTRRIHDLVSSVKRFTDMDGARVSEPTDVAQGLIDTVAVLAGKARAKSAAVRLDLAPSLPPVIGHAGELNQVWANLIDNALDAVGPSGEVIVRAEPSKNQVSVRIVDNGSGIPPEVQRRMFDPFYTTKALGQGRGLGLDTVRRILRAHEGQIAVESRPGRTEFWVTLPVDVGSKSSAS
jgi:signal transduction histidine kinase